MATSKTWIITTDPGRPIADIAKDLAEAGLVVRETLEAVGCIVGSASLQRVGKLRQVRGVLDVAPAGPVDVGPPDSPETW